MTSKLSAPVPAISSVTDTARRVVENAQRTLRDSQYQVLAQVSCEFREGILILRGRVPSFYMKQIAQTVIRDLDDVVRVDNRLEVAEASPGDAKS